MAAGKSQPTPKSKPSERKPGAARDKSTDLPAVPGGSNQGKSPNSSIGQILGPGGVGTLAVSLAANLPETWRPLAQSAILWVALLAYRFQGPVIGWVASKVENANVRREARGSCNSFEKLIAIYKERLADPDLDQGVRDKLAAEVIDLEHSLIREQRRASLGNY